MSAPEATSQGAATTQTEWDAEKALDAAVTLTRPQDQEETDRAKKMLTQFLKEAVKPGHVVSKDVERNIKHWMSEIDKKLSAQLNEIMHDEKFQKLESTWRGLHYLVHQSETSTTLKIRVLNITKKEAHKDLMNASEFDQSQTFKKIYEDEYGMPGGEPFGLIVGDYEFGRGTEDIELLQKMSNVAASAHAPFVAGTSPKMLNLESFTELPNPRDLAKIFQGVEYTKWKSFRESEDSRYVALALPRVLARVPYGEDFRKVEEFDFEESVDGKNHDKYLAFCADWAPMNTE